MPPPKTRRNSGRTFVGDDELLIAQARLPADPKKIIGSLYRFECYHGSHYHLLVGTVTAIRISDEGGLDLEVSNKQFWGQPLLSIKFNDGEWMAYVVAEKVEDRFFNGVFQLL